VDNEEFLALMRDRAKKASQFVEAAGKEAGRQLSVLHNMRLTLIAASAVTGAMLGVTVGLTLGRR
jgi:hypothetical protein